MGTTETETDADRRRERGRAVHAAGAALQARVRRGSLLGGVRRRARPDPFGPRRAASDQGPPGRLALRALLVSRRDLWLLRSQDQRPVDARLPDPDRRGAGVRQPPGPRRRAPAGGRRADGEHARDQGPGHRHGVDALEEDAPGHAMAAGRRQPTGARADRPARVDGRHHADDRLHPVRRLRVLVPVDGGRSGLHRPGGARQGLPLRR